MDFKEELAAKAEKTGAAKKNDGIKLTTNMSIVDMIKTLEPEIRKAAFSADTGAVYPDGTDGGQQYACTGTSTAPCRYP